MSLKHTQGPWNMAVNANDKICVWKGASLIAKVEHFPHEGATANALLIAAAPELLEILEKIAEAIDQDDRAGQTHDSHCRVLGQYVNQVLVKARGHK
jgi:hypothetical protein